MLGRSYASKTRSIVTPFTSAIGAFAISLAIGLPSWGAVSTPPSPTAENTYKPDWSNEETDSVAVIGGSFRVNEVGQATYTIPIWAPAGVGGMRPQVGLIYNSMGGNGVMGVGWGISGLSSIARCRETLSQSGEAGVAGEATPLTWSTSDRFCLDGQPLILWSGSQYGATGATYRTEISSYTTIKAKGGSLGHPDYFEVTGKDGVTTRFGGPGADNSEQQARNDAGAALGSNYTLTWAMDKQTNASGVFIDYIYDNNANGHNIRRIDYAYYQGAPRAQIEFQYLNHSFGNYTYVSGYRFKSEKYLNAIVVRNKEEKHNPSSWAEVRRYKFDYHVPSALNSSTATTTHSYRRLKKVEECVGSICIKPTEFIWSSSGIAFTQGTNTSISREEDDLGQSRFGDVDGDGDQDLIWVEISYANGQGTGGDDIDYYQWRYALFEEATGKYGPAQTIQHMSRSPGGLYPKDDLFAWSLLDLNADGRMDLISPFRHGAGQPNEHTWRVYLGSDTGFQPSNGNYIFETGIPVDPGEDIQVVDLNSDALPDIIYEYNNGYRYVMSSRTLSNGQWAPALSNNADLDTLIPAAPPSGSGSLTKFSFISGGEQVPVGDFNGDGNIDLLVTYSEQRNTLPDGSGINFWWPLGTAVLAVHPGGNPGGNASTLTLNYTGMLIPGFDGPNGVSITDPKQLKVTDLNGDGLADVVAADSDDLDSAKWKAYLNRGSSLSGGFKYIAIDTASTQNVHNGGRLQLADYNRDGRVDITFPHQTVLHYMLFDAKNEAFVAPKSNTSLGINNGNQYEWYQLIDVDGDLMLDFVNSSSERVRVDLHSNAGEPAQVEKITTGLGSYVEIDYTAPSSSTYARSEDANDLNTAVLPYTQTMNGGAQAILDVYPSFQLVSKVRTPLPTGSGTAPGNLDLAHVDETTYVYSGAKLEAGGRGFLGFNEVASIHAASGILTKTQYRQDFPFIGKPIITEKFKIVTWTNFQLLESSWTWWAFQNWASGHTNAPFRPYRYLDVETGIEHETDVMASYVTSSYVQDEWGNVTATEVNTYSDNDPATSDLYKTLTTSNTYGVSVADKELGRLSASTVIHSKGGAGALERKTEFTYYSNGLLKDEILNPDDGTMRRTTTHYYDSNGNEYKTVTSGDPDGVIGSAPAQNRWTRRAFDAPGRYVDATYEMSGTTTLSAPATINGSVGAAGEILTEKVLDRNQWGSPTAIEDAYGKETRITYGQLGREWYRWHESGAWSKTRYYSSRGTEICPGGTAVRIETASTEPGWQFVECQDVLGRTIRKSRLGFDGSTEPVLEELEYNAIGSILWTSLPHFKNVGAEWTRYYHDFMGRRTSEVLPNGRTTKMSYLTHPLPGAGVLRRIDTVVKVSGEADRLSVQMTNPLGQLDSTFDASAKLIVYYYDNAGNLARTTAINNVLFQTKFVDTWIYYDDYGHKTQIADPDKGSWVYNHNAFGELVRQTDDEFNRIDMTYDQMGRMRTRKVYSHSSLKHSSSWVYDKDSSLGTKPGRLLGDTAIDYNVSVGQRGREIFNWYVYDSYGRISDKTTVFEPNTGISKSFRQATTYDQAGRVFQSFDHDAQERGVEYSYNSHGYLENIYESYFPGGSPGSQKRYLHVDAMDAFGNRSEYVLGARTITRTFDPETGEAQNISGLKGTNFDRLELEFDPYGNLTTSVRHEGSPVVREETYCYDNVNRLVHHIQSSANGALCNNVSNTQITYDGFGNITKKGGQVYDYVDPNAFPGPNDPGPHAVRKIGSTTYLYDDNGNMVGGGGRSLTYSAFNKVETVSYSSNSVEYRYGPGFKRFYRKSVSSGTTYETYYVGGSEYVTWGSKRKFKRRLGGEIQVEHDLNVNGGVVSNTTDETYLLLDHLGTPIVTYDKNSNKTNGLVDSDLFYDPWGYRLNHSTQQPVPQYSFYWTDAFRGFTGHEQQDEFGLIHMNARIYDPKIGRFLQADSFIDGVANPQGYNRYSYLHNNPLNATDPTGNLKFKELTGVVVGAIGTWACSGNYQCGVWAYTAIGATAGGAQAAANGQNIMQGVVIGGISAAAFYGVGTAFSECGSCAGDFAGSKLNASAFAGKVAAHGFVGGYMSMVQGGNFGHGFASAGMTQAFAPGIDGIQAGESFSLLRIASAAIVGGTSSQLTGGSFSNGAITASFSRMFNDDAHYRKRKNTGAPFFKLDGDTEASLDLFNTKGQAGHEFHVYKGGEEIGVYADGQFIAKHGYDGSVPDGVSDGALQKLNGLDVDMQRRMGRLPKKGRMNIKGIFRNIGRVSGVAGGAFIGYEIYLNPSNASGILSGALGVTPIGDGALHPTPDGPMF